jgi:integrase
MHQRSANAIRLLILTGARRGEVLQARWSEFDLANGVWTRPSAHTKQKKLSRVPLNPIARAVLEKMPVADASGEFVFPGEPGAPVRDIKKFWKGVRKAAGLPKETRLHDLRHSFACMLVSRGLTLPVIRRLMGHTQIATTARYAHLLDATLRECD